MLAKKRASVDKSAETKTEKRIDDAEELCYFLDAMCKEHAQKEEKINTERKKQP